MVVEFAEFAYVTSSMGGNLSTKASTAPAKRSWDAELDESLRKAFGFSATGGVFFTGLDALTLPTAFCAGCVLGAGFGIWRGEKNWRRSIGYGTLLAGLTLAVPPYVRILYSPWLMIGPQGAAYSMLCGSIIGTGAIKICRPPPADEENGELWDGSVGGALISLGFYLALPGAVRVLFMYR